MIVKQLIEVFDILDSADASGLKVKEYLESKGATNVEVVKREKDGKSTDFVKVVIPGSNGRLKGGNAPSLGIIGRLGGIGARPERIGFVSDGDGALTALAAAATSPSAKTKALGPSSMSSRVGRPASSRARCMSVFL